MKEKSTRKQPKRPGNGVLKTESEMAALLGEEARTLRTWRHQGLAPFIRLGYRTIRFDPTAVIEALKAQSS